MDLQNQDINDEIKQQNEDQPLIQPIKLQNYEKNSFVLFKEYLKINYSFLQQIQKYLQEEEKQTILSQNEQKQSYISFETKQQKQQNSFKQNENQQIIITNDFHKSILSIIKEIEEIIDQVKQLNSDNDQKLNQLLKESQSFCDNFFPKSEVYIFGKESLIKSKNNGQSQFGKSALSTLIIEGGNWQDFKQFILEYQNAIELFISFFFTLMLPIYIAPLLISSYSEITSILSITLPLSFFVGLAVGGNDICNSMGTCYGSNTLTMIQVLILGCIFESLGAILLGENVSLTLSTKILNPEKFEYINQFAITMMAILGASAFSSLTVTIYGLPVSITQGVVFAMAAVGLVSCGTDGINSQGIVEITIALFTSPLVGLIVACLIYIIIIQFIKKAKNPVSRVILILPFFGFINIFVVSFLVMYKGVKIEPLWIGILISIALGIIASIVLYFMSKKLQKKQLFDQNLMKSLISQKSEDQQNLNDQLGEYFKYLLIISACCVSFTHGSNDVSNMVAPLASVLQIYNQQEQLEIPFWTLVYGAVAFSVGILLIGKRTISTMGNSVTNLDKMKSSTVQMGTTMAILLASVIGMPVSTSHCTVGSIMGATLAEKIMKQEYQFNKKSLRKIFASWVYTIPFVFLIAIYFYFALIGSLK